VAVSPATSAEYGVGPPYNASLMPTISATLNRDSSTAPTARVRRRARHSVRAANTPITSPGSANLVPSHGSAPSRAKQPKAERQPGRSWSRTACSAAPASAAPAVSSGYTALP
jgi:hypothetical protein